MAEITINNYSLGWIPGEDPIQGRKNGLLQMDNLELDSNGALTLAGGTLVKQSGLPSNAHTLFSRLINGARADYSLLVDGSIYRNGSSIGSGGNSSNGAFGTAFNYTLIASGDKRLKDDGTTVTNLGITPAAVAPDVAYSALNSPYNVAGSVVTSLVVPTGYGSYTTPGGTSLQMTANSSGFWSIQTNGGTLQNLNNLTGVEADVGYATDNDYIQFVGSTPIVLGRSFSFDVLLVSGNSSGDLVTDYYTYQVGELSDVTFSSVTGLFTLRMRRSDFTRVGPGSQDWSTTYGFRIGYSGGAPSEVVNIYGNAIGSPTLYMIGGSNAQDGQYQYVQVNVNNTGSYVAKSVAGPVSKVLNLDMGETLVTPYVTGIDSQVNEIWIYARGGLLDKWYRVKVFLKPGGGWSSPSGYIKVRDQDTLTLNIFLNTNLVSVAAATITDKIYDIIGPVNGRWYYFTTNFMYPSEINNPDLVDASIAIRITGSNSELLMWARQVNDSTILVGTSTDVYTLTGTFATFPDFSIDAYYRPLHCKYPPLTCDAEVWGGLIFYLSSDGWRSLASDGSNPSLVSPNLDRLYRGETIGTYVGPVLKVIPRSIRMPIVIAKNKMFCFITSLATPRIEVYDFIRQYWRPVLYGLGDFTAACHTQDGQVLTFFADKKLREIDLQSSHLLDAATKQTIGIKTVVFDGGYPRQRKDSSTIKLRLQNSDTITANLIVDGSATVNAVASVGANIIVKEQDFDLSIVANVAIVKTYQATLTGTVNDFILDDININYDLRPEQRNFIRIQSNNYGTTARKKVATIPFQLDSLGNDTVITPTLDGTPATGISFNSTRKQSFNYEFSSTLPVAKDYEYTIHSSGLFEFFGFGDPRIIEIYAQQCKIYVIPTTNFESACKKRVRVWPFVLSSPAGGFVTFTPSVDGGATTATTFTVGIEKQTYRHFFKTDIFGVDYSGTFTSSSEFEVNSILQPEIVQVLPIAKQFDQIGPEEFFRYGKIKQIELRVLAYGTSIPFIIYFNDSSVYNSSFTTVNGKEGSYFLTLPKGVSGNIVRIELGPTAFDFHRFYTRLQVAKSGSETELQWINI